MTGVAAAGYTTARKIRARYAMRIVTFCVVQAQVELCGSLFIRLTGATIGEPCDRSKVIF